MNLDLPIKTIAMVYVFFLLVTLMACKKPADNVAAKTDLTSQNEQKRSSKSENSGEVAAEKMGESEANSRVVFYNVENLFDIYDDPLTDDNQFLPDSEKAWTQDRYDKKLANLSRVIKAVGNGSVPDIIGLCEVENKAVVSDLIKNLERSDSYKIVHKDSPDARGIDAALIYNADKFELVSEDFLKIDLPVPFDSMTTRDIVYAELKSGGENIHIFVNHWSSRRGGEEKTRPKRAASASAARAKVESIMAKDPEAKILLMGDFNDEPSDPSLISVLKAHHTTGRLETGQLYNLSAQLAQDSTVGTYNYRGKWNVLDQFIVSADFLTDRKGLHSGNSARVFRKKWLTYNDKKDGPKPSKTYGGKNYYGGFSDHYPIYIDLQW